MLVNKLMAVAPFVLLAGIGVQSRTYADDYQPVSSSPEHDQATLAYRDEVIATRHILAQPTSPDRTRALRRLAARWTEGAKSGRLKTLRPVAYDDTSMEGVRGDITGLTVRLTVELTILGRREHDAGELQTAAEHYLRALRVAEVTKYFDFQSVTKGAMAQRRTVTLLTQLIPSLPEDERIKVADALTELQNGQRSLSDIGILTRRQYLEASAREGRQPLGIEAAPQMVTYRQLFQGDRPDQEKITELRSLMLVSNRGPDQPEFVSVASIALQTQTHLVDDLESLTKTLRGGR